MAEDGARTQLAMKPLVRPQLTRDLELEVITGPDQGRRFGPLPLPIRIGSAEGNEVRLTDPTVSRFHLGIEPSALGPRAVDASSTNGTFIGGARIERAILAPGVTVTIGQTSLVVRLKAEDRVIELSPQSELGMLIGDSPVMRALFSLLSRLALNSVSVHLTGETGTGKELVARALHSEGPRKAGPMVVVDCGAIAPTLVESELFGHQKGAFTGADEARIGALELANGGTLFLDEIGELPLGVQPKLLRVLETGTFKPLGAGQEKSTAVRVVSATHRDLRRMVNEGTFREDLYFRLAVVPVAIPPLRERKGDIPRLARHFLAKALAISPAPEPSPETLAFLAANDWPGNVRELKNAIERAVALGEPERVEAGHLEEALRAFQPSADPGAGLKLPLEEAKARFEREYLVKLWAEHDGDKERAAAAAGIHPKSLERLIRRHQLKDEL